jgi:translocator protein
MMAVAAWLVWRQGGFAVQRLPLTLFIVQLALNAAWTPIFFGAQWFGVAMLEIVLLWCAILATMIAFRQTSPAAGWLMLPYFLWVSYASTLNAGIWWLNRK